MKLVAFRITRLYMPKKLPGHWFASSELPALIRENRQLVTNKLVEFEK